MATQGQDTLDWDELSESLRDCLDSIETEGSFNAKGVFEDVNPGLEIEGLGGIGMPVSQHDALRIIEKSRQAPFGKGSETLVDTSVRNTWEIDAVRIRCAHPKWPAFQQSVLDSACKQLGVPGGAQDVRAEPYKLLVYETGALFKSHKDTEKTPGMFGTLVVSLPSEHEGGDVSVSFNGSSEVLQTSANSRWSSSYLAWYSDVLHEVKPITSGYRIVLTYNLVNTGSSPTPSIATGDPRLAAMQSYLKRWSHNIDDDNCNLPSHLIYMLAHEYTEESLCIEGLKGKDLNRIKGLLDVVEGGDCVCYLSSIVKRIYGGCDGFGFEDGYDDLTTHSIADIVEESLELERIVSMNGRKIIDNVSIEEAGVIMQEDPFANDPDEEDFEGWTGNEGANATHWYRDSALIIMPRSCALDYFVSAATEGYDKRKDTDEDRLCDVINYYSDLYEDSTDDESTRSALCRLIDMIVQGHRYLSDEQENMRTYSCHSVAAAARASLLVDRPLRFTQLMKLKSRLPSGLFAKFMPHASKYSFDQIREGLELAVLQGDDLDHRIIATHVLSRDLKQYLSEQSAAFKPWLENLLDRLLSQGASISKLAIDPLLEMLCSVDDIKSLVPSAIDTLRESVRSMEFAFSIIEALSPRHETELGRETTIHIIQEIMPTLISSIALPRNPPLKPKLTWLQWQRLSYRTYDPEPLPEKKDLTGDLICMLHQSLVELNMKDETLALLQRIEQESAHVATIYFDDMLFPYLEQVVKSFTERDILIGNFEQPIRGILRNWRDRVSGPQPPHPTNWAQQVPATLCGSSAQCEECSALQKFVSEPNARTARFTVVTKKRQHIETMLANTGRHVPSGGHEASGSDYDFKTEKYCQPFTLVVTKTTRHWHRAVSEWQSRTAAVESKIGQLGLPRNVLHDNSHEPSSSHTPAIAEQTQPSMAGEKRKRAEQDENVPPSKKSSVEVIDLVGSP